MSAETPIWVVVTFTGKHKQVITTNEPESEIRQKLKIALANKEIDSYTLYRYENYIKFNP